MKKLIPPVCFLWLCLMPALCFSQDNEWVMGEWKGGYFGEKSKLTKKFASRLIITKVYGNMFEGVVQCILPSDTAIRLHTRIAGRIYPNYLMTKLKEVVYYKDPPGQYTWAKHCFTCDSMKLTFAKRGDVIVLNGERKCDTLCNIIASYTKPLSTIAKKTPYKGPTRYENEFELVTQPAPPPGARAQQTAVAANPATTAGAAATTNTGAITTTGAAANSVPKGVSAAGASIAKKDSTKQTASPPASDQASLGQFTPGIDRDNIYAASMPTRSGGTIFARPIFRDTLSANYTVAGRTVVSSARFTVYADSAEVLLMDNGEVDGDTVSLYYNGQIILSKKLLTVKPISIKIPVYRGGTNVLTVYAESMGLYPPNTAYVRLICGDKETSFLLSSTMSKSSSIELFRSDTNSY